MSDPTQSSPLSADSSSAEGEARSVEAAVEAAAGGRRLQSEAARLTFLERYFNRALGWVQVHQNADAQRVLARLNAEAACFGRDVYVHPSTDLSQPRGVGVLGHEVQHAIQQRGRAPLWQLKEPTTRSTPGVVKGLMTGVKKTVAAAMAATTVVTATPAFANQPTTSPTTASKSYQLPGNLGTASLSGNTLTAGGNTLTLSGNDLTLNGSNLNLGNLGNLGSSSTLNPNVSLPSPTTLPTFTNLNALGEAGGSLAETVGAFGDLTPGHFFNQAGATTRTPTIGRTLFQPSTPADSWSTFGALRDSPTIGTEVGASGHFLGSVPGTGGFSDVEAQFNARLGAYWRTRYIDVGVTTMAGVAVRTEGIESLNEFSEMVDGLGQDLGPLSDNASAYVDSSAQLISRGRADLQGQSTTLTDMSGVLSTAQLGSFGSSLSQLMSQVNGLTQTFGGLSNDLGTVLGGANGLLEQAQGVAERIQNQEHNFALEFTAGAVVQSHMTGRVAFVEGGRGIIKNLVGAARLKAIHVPKLGEKILGVDRALMAVRADFHVAIQGAERLHEVLGSAQSLVNELESTRVSATSLLESLNAVAQNLPAGQITQLEASIQAAMQTGSLTPSGLASLQSDLQALAQALGGIEFPDLSQLQTLDQNFGSLADRAKELESGLQALQSELRVEADALLNVVSSTGDGLGLDLALQGELNTAWPVRFHAQAENLAGYMSGREDVYRPNLAGMLAGEDPRLDPVSSKNRNVYHDFFAPSLTYGLGLEVPGWGTRFSLAQRITDKHGSPVTSMGVTQPFGPHGYMSYGQVRDGNTGIKSHSLGLGYSGSVWGLDLKATGGQGESGGAVDIKAGVHFYLDAKARLEDERRRGRSITLMPTFDHQKLTGAALSFKWDFAKEQGRSFTPGELQAARIEQEVSADQRLGGSGRPLASAVGLRRQNGSNQPGLGGNGQPLPPRARRSLESYLGVDLGHVRVHNDGAADALARGAGAKAFAYGDHVYFQRQHWNPSSAAGMGLIAHEVAHTLQQGAGGLSPASSSAPLSGKVFQNVRLNGLGSGPTEPLARAVVAEAIERAGAHMAKQDVDLVIDLVKVSAKLDLSSPQASQALAQAIVKETVAAAKAQRAAKRARTNGQIENNASGDSAASI